MSEENVEIVQRMIAAFVEDDYERLVELFGLSGRFWEGPTTSTATSTSRNSTGERRVAELAATGDTNRQIAQTLFVTEKTVETHLGRAFRKLDISSRRHLPDVLTGVAD